jgi:hypothetical protein
MPPFLMAGARFLLSGVCSITKLRIQLMNVSGIAGVEEEIMSRQFLIHFLLTFFLEFLRNLG